MQGKLPLRLLVPIVLIVLSGIGLMVIMMIGTSGSKTPTPTTAPPTKPMDNTPTPRSNDTLTITPAPTDTPTSTPTDTPTPTSTPTDTPTPTPMPTDTPTATSTPIPLPVYLKPQLIGHEVSRGCNVTFCWSWDHVLAENEYFAIRADIGHPGESRVWTKETRYTTSLAPPSDNYIWEVAICRGDPATHHCEQLTVSDWSDPFFIGDCPPNGECPPCIPPNCPPGCP